MSSHPDIPIYTNTPQHYQPPPTTKPPRHHRTRYYAHRVKESLTTRVSKFLCSCLLTFLFVLGLVAFIVWLSIRPHRPRFHVITFNVMDVDKDNGLATAVITFNVTTRNPNQSVGIYYYDMEAIVFYRERQVGKTPLAVPFYQPHKNTTFVDGVLSGAPLGVTDESWKREISAGTVVFRLELKSVIRFKIANWESMRQRMHASCDVGVGPDGQMVATYKARRCSIYFF